jgi:hypothetical protein
MFSSSFSTASLSLSKYNEYPIVSTLPHAIVVSDFDLDGDQDVIYAKGDWPTGEILTGIQIWKNENGQLVSIENEITSLNFLSFPGRIKLADFNQDGLMDLYIGTFGNEVNALTTLTARDEILLNRGNFNFERITNDFFPKSWSHGSSVGDLNNDGRDDVFVSGMVGNTSYFVLNLTTGWQASSTNITGDGGEIRDGVEDSYIIDLNLDGYNDLLVGGRGTVIESSVDEINTFPPHIYWGTAQGIGTESTVLPSPTRIPTWDLSGFGSSVDDLNGDGLPDIVMTHTNGSGDGVIVEDRYYPAWLAKQLGLPGKPTASVNSLSVLINNGDGTFEDVSEKIVNNPQTDVSNYSIQDSNTYFDLKLVDFNQDGHLDIWAADLSIERTNPPFVFINDGKGNFTGLDIAIDTNEIHYGIFVADVDNNGFPDIVSMDRENFEGSEVTGKTYRDGMRVMFNQTERTSSNYYGTAEDDYFVMPYSSYYKANAGDDRVKGSDGNDSVNGSFGNDTVDGGLGVDLLIFNWAKSNYQLDLQGINGIVTSNQEGQDVFYNIERLQFTDTNLALDTDGVAGQAYRIYKAAFDRAPDLEGLGYWINDMDQGASLVEVAGGFIASEEFLLRYGSNTSDKDFIRLLYENVLDRQPDATGYDYWQKDMLNGMTRSKMLINFSESAENQQNVSGLIQNGIEYTAFML